MESMPDEQSAQQTSSRDITVYYFMTRDPVTVTPETLLVDAAQTIMEHKLDGVPVVDRVNKLVGILTEYDLISKGSLLHIPTFIRLLQDLQLYQKDKTRINKDLTNLFTLKVGEVMNKEPLTVQPNATLEDAVKIFAEHHRVNPIPVVGKNGILVGVLSRYDIIKFYAPASFAPISYDGKATPSDDRIDRFIKKFEEQFILIPKRKAHLWAVGIVVALFIAAISLALYFI